jgi:hypothetical protein
MVRPLEQDNSYSLHSLETRAVLSVSHSTVLLFIKSSSLSVSQQWKLTRVLWPRDRKQQIYRRLASRMAVQQLHPAWGHPQHHP